MRARRARRAIRAGLSLAGLALLMALIGLACSESQPTREVRFVAAGGKADLPGSCNNAPSCDARSTDGCYCDAQCTGYNDCCSDYRALCVSPNLPLALDGVDSAETFEATAAGDGGVLIQGKAIKFLIDRRDASAPRVQFVNAQYKDAAGQTPESARYHYHFARATLAGFSESIQSFNDKTYWTQNKSYVAGTVQTYRLGNERVYGIQFYPQDVIAEQPVLEAVRLVKSKFTIAGARVAFVATGQQQTSETIKDALAQLGVERLTVDAILGQLKYIPMNTGEAWGYLRIFPADQGLLSALDIPVFAELPLDLTVVAATITKAFQDTNSHVNLKSKERKTPNMVLRDASLTHALLAQWAEKPVHLVVDVDGFTITASSDAEVLAKYRERTNKPWVTLPFTPSTAMPSYAEMCPTSPADCLALTASIGSKAAHLGFLTHRDVLGRTSDAASLSAKLGYEIVPPGVGLPLSFYKRFVEHAPNTALRAKLSQLIADEKQGTWSTAQRVAAIADVTQAFYRATFPPELLAQIRARLVAVMPTHHRFKLRSSANAEDITDFDGAGLYDSYPARLDRTDNADGSCERLPDQDDPLDIDMVPKTLNCALKGVYASLWNKRAVEERSYARLDHATSLMGVAVVPRYANLGKITSNAVVITRVVNAPNVYGYGLSIQDDNNTVTNPLAGTHSETTIAAFADPGMPASFITTRYAKPKADKPALTTRVMSQSELEAMLEISRRVELRYCQHKPSYYAGNCAWVHMDSDKPTSLDMEFKVLEGGKILCKQAREFSGK